MSLRSWSGNAANSGMNKISGWLESAKGGISGIINTAKTGFSGIWSGGFTGMSKEGLADLQQNLRSYCDQVEQIIAQFNADADLEVAFKGAMNDGMQVYVKAIKELLQAYVTTLKQEIDEADSAYSNFEAMSSQFSSDVQSDAEAIKQQAQAIRID